MKSKLVRGVGINDAGYPVNVYAVIDGRQKQLWRCPIYQAWKEMLTRCYSEKYQANKPTYAGCTVAPEWLTFSAFHAWMVAQPWEGSQMDKDLLSPGNRVYGPDACVFLSGQLNSFMTDCSAARGQYQVGVSLEKATGKFMAKCRDPFVGKQEFLGYFTCPDEAHEAWRQRKHQHACTYADMQSDPRIAQALRARYLAQESE